MEDRSVLKQIYDGLKVGRSYEEIVRHTVKFEKLMSYYWCAIREVETKFRVLDNQLSIGGKRNPIESIKTRLKSFQSIQGKLQKLELPVSCEAIEDNLNDVAGVRVICSYIDDIYMLADCFLRQDDITLIQKKDYIAAPKPNGYRSLHLIIEIPVFLANEKRSVKVEVQLRTIVMESWANLEHNMRYKKDLSQDKLTSVSEMLNECAEISHSLDMKMQQARDIVETKSESV